MRKVLNVVITDEPTEEQKTKLELALHILKLQERVNELEAEKAEVKTVKLAGLTNVNGHPIPVITIRPEDQN